MGKTKFTAESGDSIPEKRLKPASTAPSPSASSCIDLAHNIMVRACYYILPSIPLRCRDYTLASLSLYMLVSLPDPQRHHSDEVQRCGRVQHVSDQDRNMLHSLLIPLHFGLCAYLGLFVIGILWL